VTFGGTASYREDMKRSAGAAALAVVVLAASACASGHPAGRAGLSSLPTAVEKQAKAYLRTARATPGSSVQSIAVYGPGSRRALVRASSGDIVEQTGTGFYLFVLQGHFVCADCSGPAGHKAPTGTFETFIWSPTAGGTDFGISHSLPSTVSRLHRLALATLT
jgi:hypothetical protein